MQELNIEELKFKLTGTTPLILHNCRTANPLDPYTQAMKPLTSKKKKTDIDYRELARIEWEAGLYLQGGVVVIPAQNLDACFQNAAKHFKMGEQYKRGAQVSEIYIPLQYKGPKIDIGNGHESIPIEALNKHYDRYKCQDIVNVKKNKVLRTRPKFEDWSLSVTIQIDKSIFDNRSIVDIVTVAGQYVGLCEHRPRMGKFEVEIIQ